MKTVLIIGGSSGIGDSCVTLFEKNKWQVFATFFSHKRSSRKESLVQWSHLDITDADATQNFAKGLPSLDAVIICAAKNSPNKTLGPTEDIESIFHTNVIGQIKMITLLKNKLRRNSSIILFGSITGKNGSARRISYSSSKSAIYGLVKSLAVDLAPDTRVNAICPGYINTAQYTKNSSISASERTKSILLGRLGKPSEVAKLTYFLASSDASYINAQSIYIDGGVQ